MKRQTLGKPDGSSVTFWGAAQAVTGSMHLVEAAHLRLLLDCGLVLGWSSFAQERNRNFPFPPSSLAAVVLSHAHIDHCGNLPNLCRQGFRGNVYCTFATRDLAAHDLATHGSAADGLVIGRLAARRRREPERARARKPPMSAGAAHRVSTILPI